MKGGWDVHWFFYLSASTSVGCCVRRVVSVRRNLLRRWEPPFPGWLTRAGLVGWTFSAKVGEIMWWICICAGYMRTYPASKYQLMTACFWLLTFLPSPPPISPGLPFFLKKKKNTSYGASRHSTSQENRPKFSFRVACFHGDFSSSISFSFLIFNFWIYFCIYFFILFYFIFFPSQTAASDST